MNIIIFLLMLTHHCMGFFEPRQMPQPDLSALRDDVGTLPLSNDYMPAVMQALHYFTEMMQYEQVKNPVITTMRPQTTTKTTKRTSTSRTTLTTKRTTTTTTKRTPPPTTTTTKRVIATTPRPPLTTTQEVVQKPHKPGVYAPEKPPYYIYFEIPIKPEQAYHKPGIQQPVHDFNTISPPDWKDPSFVSWFFQPKPPRVIDQINENDLQYLDVLPKRLLLDILNEPYNLPAISDLDNVNEFRKKYDDSYNRFYRKGAPNTQMLKMNMKIQMYQQRATLTGKKKPPPTRPYVLMVMLYDQLKKEAKARKLHQFGGFTPELLDELHHTSQTTGVDQMKFLMESMLSRKEVSDLSVIKRVNDILADLNNTKSDAYKILTIIPPLPFLP